MNQAGDGLQGERTVLPCCRPVAIFAFGPFRVELEHGERVELGGRCRLLLQALLALGGRAVPEARLAALLWPDAEGPAARRSFDTTLHRVRRTLRAQDAVKLRGGLVSLSTELCQVDVDELEQVAGRVRSEGAGQLNVEARRALSLYQGVFLADVEDAPWAVSRRERLHARYLALVTAHAVSCEEHGEYVEAIATYSAALEIDDLHEPFYQGLIGCLSRLGRRSEARRVFERCRRRFQHELAVGPSNETARLARVERWPACDLPLARVLMPM
jgi:LuxR family transcriptional regulator, maltose regulon positive regulatory protein